MINSSDNVCPLCGQKGASPYFEDHARCYLLCSLCGLVFVPRADYLSRDAEIREYDLHTNDPGDKGYRKFLSRLSRPLSERLGPKQNGLDFGCGPGPVLHRLLRDQGHQIDLYDPVYFKNTAVFSNRYDFITASEVVEHFHNPGREFDRLFSLLQPRGWLGIMTKLVRDRSSFATWHYIRDLTHVCFYCRETFGFIADQYNASLSFIGEDVILLQKRG